MENIIKISLLVCLGLDAFAQEEIVAEDEHRKRIHSVRAAIANVTKTQDKELDTVDGIKHMFEDGTVSGEIRSMYSRYNYKQDEDQYAGAIGGYLKYELAEYKGFNAAVTFTTSNSISYISGDSPNFNPEMTSDNGSYTELSELYLNYKYKDFNLRVGRQIIDTPLADGDDIRMGINTFEAYILTYTKNDFTFMSGRLDRFQGYDAGLDVDNPWQDTGEDGTYLAGLAYETDYLEGSVWYYDISKDTNPSSLMGNNANKSIYLSVGGHFHFDKEIFIHAIGQYLHQNEKDNSGVKSRVYGGMAEFVVENIGFNIAYNQASKQKGKRIFSGFGGGTMFTSMDNMIIENIAIDRDAYAMVSGISYGLSDVNLLYAYGDFHGDADSNGLTEHITEHNVGCEYVPNDNITVAAIFTEQTDKDNTGSNGGDWRNFRVLASYSF